MGSPLWLTPGMAWILLLLAGILEVIWAIAVKQAHGFTRVWPTVTVVVTGVSSVVLLGQATRVIPIGTAYAVWTGIGGSLTALLGMMLFGEPTTTARLVCLVLILGGIVGLRVLSSH